MPRALILDGPHQGSIEVPEHQGDMLKLVDPGSGWSPATYQLYRLVEPQPGDFQRGIEARYIWVP